jgi:hypothetical protein
MTTYNRLNKVSRVLRQNIHGCKSLIMVSGVPSFLGFAVSSVGTAGKARLEMEDTVIRNLKGATRYSLTKAKNNKIVLLLWKYCSKYFQPSNLPLCDHWLRHTQDPIDSSFFKKYKFPRVLFSAFKGLNLLCEPQAKICSNDIITAQHCRFSGKFYDSVYAKF